MVRSMILAAVILTATPALATEHVVMMAGRNYSPDQIDAAKGDTIRFVNDDGVDHKVFVPTVGFGLDLGTQEPGQEVVHNLFKSGDFEVECVFHANMYLQVSVK